jgi:hypothetical protein
LIVCEYAGRWRAFKNCRKTVRFAPWGKHPMLEPEAKPSQTRQEEPKPLPLLPFERLPDIHHDPLTFCRAIFFNLIV